MRTGKSNGSSISRKAFIRNGSLLALSYLLPFELKATSRPDSMNNLERYDVIIVGGSYSGLAAGMALSWL